MVGVGQSREVDTGSAQVGNVARSLADWLRDGLPLDGVYDHRILHKLREFGFTYDEETQLLAWRGLLTPVKTFTYAELIKYKLATGIQEGGAERTVMALHVAWAVHRLVRPFREIPATGKSDKKEYKAVLESIAE